MKGTTKSQGQKDPLDRFYTAESTAAFCLSQLDLLLYSLIIEPSAGRGSFSNQIENCLAFDIDPQAAGI